MFQCNGPNGSYNDHELGTWEGCSSCSSWQRKHDPDTIILENDMLGKRLEAETEHQKQLALEERRLKKSLTLDPTDKFDRVIIDMVGMNRKKRRDYAADTDIFSNFRDVASNLGMESFGPAEAAYVLLLAKVARLRSLRINGRMSDPSNESVLDTFFDLAVYATLVLALVKEAGDE